ncbi:DUF937 domain-containing protein [Intrasporangium calvum]|uniref:DUF937 domain-containing protein n=1 Tax=Intrasporangium calvum TaxID=53358 RepID=UPI000DF61C20|nr:DUF937 domain-containing protein [Intrasporangium calvum]AXG13860.1 DUF937 domain-containing protein [Intrasporangium calvum]
MSQYDEILDQVPVQQLAGEFGVGEEDVRAAVEQALPALLGGLQANAEDPAGAASIAQALGEHDRGAPRDLAEVDVADGEKIVGHIFGGNTDQVVDRLTGASGVSGVSGAGGVSGDLVKKLLPILAPIVLSWLAGKLRGQGGLGGVLGDLIGGGSPSAQTPGAPPPAPGPVDNGPLFPGGQGAQSGPTQAPGGTGAGQPQESGSNPITDILGGILGGSGRGDVLGGILGDLLGGGRRR